MRVLIVGLGSIAKKHVAALRRIDADVQLFALRSSMSAKPWEGIKDFFTWDDALAHDYDFAIISNPTSEHISTIKQLLVKQIPLFIEKPLDNKLIDENIIEDIEKHGLITYIACNLRFLDCLKAAKEIVEAHRVNEVNVYCGSYLPDWRLGTDYRKVYSAIPELGGGVHIDLIHEIDYTCWLCGIPQSVQGIFSNKSSIGIRAYDYANYVFSYDGFNASIVLNYYRRDYKRTVEIVCEDATYLVNLATNTITKGDELLFSSTQKMMDTYLPQMEYFVECCKQGIDTFNNIREANRVLNICLK